MKEKDYPTLEEETECTIAAEPAGYAICSSVGTPKPSLVIPSEVPSTIKMAIAEIDEGEKEFERGETFTHAEVIQMVWNKITSYAG